MVSTSNSVVKLDSQLHKYPSLDSVFPIIHNKVHYAMLEGRTALSCKLYLFTLVTAIETTLTV